jgi:hypothetical protein
MLIAHLKAHLVSGDTVELLPVRHETDVKKEVTELLNNWASSGFLMREKYVYPWHQVKTVEIAVENVSQEQASQKMVNLQGSDRTKLNEEFWQGNRQL